MRKGSALALVACVFLVGLASGALTVRLFQPHPAEASRRPTGPPHLRGFFLHGDLDLSAEQQRRLEEVFRGQRRKFEQLHRDLRPQVEALMAETEERIEEILTPEQLERFRERRRHWRHRPRHRRPEPPPLGSPPTDGR